MQVEPQRAGTARSPAPLAWVDVATGAPRDALQGWFVPVAAAAWPGLRVLQGRGAPGEVGDGWLVNHVVALNAGGPWISEVWRPGRGWTLHALAPGTVSVYPAEARFAVRWRVPREAILVELTAARLEAAAAAEGASGEVVLGPALGVEDALLSNVARALAAAARAGPAEGTLAAEGLGLALAAHLLRAFAVVRPRVHREPPLAAARLARVLALVRDRLAAPLTLEELAAAAGMDLFAFARAFKRSTGLPPHRFVMRERIELAKALLRDPALSVSEVALKAGFATPSHFAATFRRLVRTTPRAFRDALR